MTKKSASKTGRTSSGSFVTLNDGRKLSKPPSGGKFSKIQIRKAVRSANTTQRAKTKTG